MEILLVTERRWPDLIPDEAHLIEALRARGFEARAAIWNDPSESWDSAAAVVIRNPWDYFDYPTEFDQWLSARERAGNCLNPAAMARWNGHKGYLGQLAALGVPIPRTVDLPAGQKGQVPSTPGITILKPAVAGNAQGCRRFAANEIAALEAALEPEPVDRLLQEYLPAIESEGEWSLVFLGGEFSHAVRKVPAEGDFRVQTSHGGSYEAGSAPKGFAEVAKKALAAIPKELGEALYARVDLVESGDGRGPLLMELEMIEPELFFRFEPKAAPRFAAALARRLNFSG